MGRTGIAAILLIVFNIAISYKGFTNPQFFERFKFEIDKILIRKDYKRHITSAFLHGNWFHLIFNIICLYSFSRIIEIEIGDVRFLIIYFSSIIGGNLLSLYVHRNHGDYSAIGASGGICGIIFATIALYPNIEIGFIGLPFTIPSWIYGILYVLFCIYGIKSDKDNIGHDAHLGGGLTGIGVALSFFPFVFFENYITILLIVIPSFGFIYILLAKPHFLLIDSFSFKKNKNYYSPDHKYNDNRNNYQKEIDKILDKINKNGIESLTQKEQLRLNEYSKNL